MKFRNPALTAACSILALIAIVQFSLFGPAVGNIHADDENSPRTATPIKHVIIIVGENRSFDHIFATYKPKPGESVSNLLSKGIINEDGTPGPNYSLAQQYSANVTGSPVFQLSPTTGKTLYPVLPAPLNGGPTNVCTDNGMCNLGDATSSEDGLSRQPVDYYESLLAGGTGLSGKVPDTRIQGVHGSAPYSTLPPGPFQLTNSGSFPYLSYANSPVHRFYQMWQQEDCNAAYATAANPSGCKADLFTWTEVTVGSNVNGNTQPANFSTDYVPGKVTTGEGATAMGFYNVLEGDAPYTKELADNYAMSDNYHQPAMGGTGLDSIILGFGDAIWFSDENSHALVPPHDQMTRFGGPVDEIENPNPVAGTNNWWTQDGYGGFGNNGASVGVFGGGSYSNCSDPSQPGVGPVVSYLSSLNPPISPNCDPGHYYLLNNYNPGYFGDGSDAYTDTNPNNTPFTIPGTTQRSIADVLLENNISWNSYNDQWDLYLGDKYQLNYGKVGPQSDQYCNICNPFQYQKQIMTNDAIRTAHITNTDQLYKDIENGKLPAVSFVKPSGWVDGHPASSKWDLFEGFVIKIVQEVQSKPGLWNSTAIFITEDEGGGYYDSGYVQPLDFFGDGTRIPLIVVSPYTKPGHISHAYADHVSLLKFIERNWHLGTISGRSRDNLPNPTTAPGNPYVPTNRPAITDLFDLFQF
ncbi:MAG: phosphoesterase [Acidobacteria bacterium]|nr:MAG: phosphoesterase [Acidobacteriota bacterium]